MDFYSFICVRDGSQRSSSRIMFSFLIFDDLTAFCCNIPVAVELLVTDLRGRGLFLVTAAWEMIPIETEQNTLAGA